MSFYSFKFFTVLIPMFNLNGDGTFVSWMKID